MFAARLDASCVGHDKCRQGHRAQGVSLVDLVYFFRRKECFVILQTSLFRYCASQGRGQEGLTANTRVKQNSKNHPVPITSNKNRQRCYSTSPLSLRFNLPIYKVKTLDSLTQQTATIPHCDCSHVTGLLPIRCTNICQGDQIASYPVHQCLSK